MYLKTWIPAFAGMTVNNYELSVKRKFGIRVSPDKCQSTCIPSFHHQEKGFSLPLAIFILVIVSLLALAIFRMTALNQQAVAQEVLTARALFAAESAAQIQMMRLFPISGGANCSAQTINFPSSGLTACSASSTCVSKTVSGTTYYTIESNGRCTVADVTALRTIEVEAK